MLTTLTWWGIGIIGVATTIFAFSFEPLAGRWEEKHPNPDSGKLTPEEEARLSVAAMMCLAFVVIVLLCSWTIAPKSPVMIPEIITWVLLVVALFTIKSSVSQIISFGAISIIIPTIFALLVTIPSFSFMSRTHDTTRAMGENSTAILIRSKLIEQNAQHTEAEGENGDFTITRSLICYTHNQSFLSVSGSVGLPSRYVDQCSRLITMCFMEVLVECSWFVSVCCVK